MGWKRNLLQYILLTVVLVQFCFISQLIQNGKVENPSRSCDDDHHIVKRSNNQFATERECPPGCRRVLKRPSSQNLPPQSEQRLHSFSYFADQGRRMKLGEQLLGFPGSRGIPGMQGQAGGKGPAGVSGIPGRQGLTGRSGSPGEQGSPGRSGSPGEQGSPGRSGSPGEQGSPGRSGSPGEQGSPGRSGSPGAQGSPGRIGLTGEQGPNGPAGGFGRGGERGRPGQAGARGMPGISGPTGFPESGVGDVRGQESRGDQGHPIDMDEFSRDSRLGVKELKVAQALQTLKLYNNPNCIDDVNHQKVMNRLKEKGTVSFMILVDLSQNVFCILHS